MYKRYTLDQLQSFWWNFINNLKRIIKQENCASIKDFLKNQFTFWDTTYYRDGTEASFRFQKIIDSKNHTSYILADEKEKIEFIAQDEDIRQLASKIKINGSSGTDSVLDTLFGEYQQQSYRTINGKPYIVYDVETLYATPNLKWLAFELGYTTTSSDYDESFDKQFKYVEKEAIKKYVDFLLDWDGYIIGFNNIWFDNIVIAYNAWYDQQEINKLNEKTIDIFYYLWNLTNKRMGLNKVATALVGLQKTLTWGWVEWTELLKDRLNTGNKESLKKVKDYCKWDVKMTLGVLLYFYKFWEFFIDWEQHNFSEEEFIKLGKNIKKLESKNNTTQIQDWLF